MDAARHTAMHPAIDAAMHIERDTETHTATPKETPKENSFGVEADEKLIETAEELFTEDKVLEAQRLLQRVHNRTLLTKRHHEICRVAGECEAAIADLRRAPGTDWTKQGESHSRYDTDIFYKVDERARLTCRLETAMGASMLVPLLSVMNESNLYHTWVPSWNMPKIGIRTSQMLERVGRVNQIMHIVGDVPWPFSTREVTLRTVAVDEIDQNGYFAVLLNTPPREARSPVASECVASERVERVDFDGALLFRSYPSGVYRPSFTHEHEESLILVSFKMFADPKLSGVPTGFLSFVTRTVIGDVWGMLLKVAEDVKDGQRMDHRLAIESNPELYRFVQERIDVMLDKMKRENEERRFIAYLQS